MSMVRTQLQTISPILRPLPRVYEPVELLAFACGNGNTTLIKNSRFAILMDMRCAPESTSSPLSQTANRLRAALNGQRLNLFVLSHPDTDHCLGFESVFRTLVMGSADTPDRIIVDEIWCTSDALQKSPFDAAVLMEIRRRHSLRGTPESLLDGNRLLLVDSHSHGSSGYVSADISYTILWPRPGIALGTPPNCSDDVLFDYRSMVVQWTIHAEESVSHILVGSDAPVEIWELLGKLYEDTPAALQWDILVAPGHGSRRSIGRVYRPTGRVTCDGSRDGEYLPSDRAEQALSHQRGNGFIILSSEPLGQTFIDPPSLYARNRYCRILARGKDPTLADQSRLLILGGTAAGTAPRDAAFVLGEIAERKQHIRTLPPAAFETTFSEGPLHDRTSPP